MQKRYLNVDIGSIVYLVFSTKKLGNEKNIVVKCEVEKAIVYKDSTVYCCKMIKIVTKHNHKEELVKGWVTTFMFENANIDTGYKGGVPNRYPVFTTKEKCIEWLQN